MLLLQLLEPDSGPKQSSMQGLEFPWGRYRAMEVQDSSPLASCQLNHGAEVWLVGRPSRTGPAGIPILPSLPVELPTPKQPRFHSEIAWERGGGRVASGC